ncbi:hypothetical protein [Bartonella tribocorum]|uniref:Uncharacterized protein n=1 Tax=Bartonella tribocorum (strain DSM 28219 / CCUG 45778 / CIP 105476 / IBS 506) TaxID=382640 RepID=A9IV08_BART1|nr:hypothetical protein [Bartonella tribocorum]CAK01627.1 hypothetical protein BT_1257 [Bartonella tribocorum CIP 105476]CAK01781.1 hypothetical protein BT_1422 [Bartonella tribocorum CIP 105476]CDO48872.1 hypothetical protein BM1374166_01194 [Bartonella tribocorum]
MKTRGSHQLDFFQRPVFPCREPVAQIDLERFRSRIKRAMARALRECRYERSEVAERMAHYLGIGCLSKASLDAYVAESKQVDISLPRFKAFVRATGAFWLWDEVVSEDGLLLLQGDEARLAEIARLQQEQREIAARLKAMRATPVRIKRGQP